MSYFFYFFDKIQWPKATWETNYLFQLYDSISQSITKESEQEAEGRSWSRGPRRSMLLIALLSMVYSAYFLIYHLTIGKSFLCQTLTDKTHYKFVHRPVWGRNFLSWGSVFPDDFSLCQANIKPASTQDNLWMTLSSFQPTLLKFYMNFYLHFVINHYFTENWLLVLLTCKLTFTFPYLDVEHAAVLTKEKGLDLE